MNTIGQILLSLLGLIGGSLFLYFGAEGLVKGSSSVAIKKRDNSFSCRIDNCSIRNEQPRVGGKRFGGYTG